MDEKEPGYWVRWAAGIVAAIVAGVLVAVLPGAFKQDDPPPTPTPTTEPTPASVRITQFSVARRSLGEYPEATFTVYNAGGDSADRCKLEWHPFDSGFLGFLAGEAYGGAAKFSGEFAVEPGTSETLMLDGPYSAGLAESAAMVKCSNAMSGMETSESDVEISEPPFELDWRAAPQR